MSEIVEELQSLASRPAFDSPAYKTWLQQKEPLVFLERNARDEELVVYAAAGNAFIHAVFVPASKIRKADAEDLLKWSGNPYSSWGVCTSFKPKPQINLEPPLRMIGSKAIAAGEQLIFIRQFDGLTGERSNYVELLQKFIHVSDIHYVRERNAWCTLDANGDLVDMARIVNLASTEGGYSRRVVLVNRSLIERYAVMTRASLVRMFDFTYFTPEQFSSWETDREEVIVDRGGLIYRQWIQSDASFARGVQVINPELTKTELLAEYDVGTPGRASRKYASFIAHDWKNKKICEISCSPDSLANYFTKSDKPFEVTPAFFRPEVLRKYKADTEKYTVESRAITCRGAWHLQSYDINSAGQVHTYLIYLSRLPYDEQLYWRSFNEAPKALISERALISDFNGEFADLDDPVEKLKGFLRSLVKQKVPWWTLRDDDLIRQLIAPATNSADEWANDLLNLDKSVVEGLQEKWLRNKAQELGRNLDDRARSLKALEECLVGMQFEPDHARELLTPLHEVHNLRSEQKGHPAGATARTTREKILSEYRTFRKHFTALCRRCFDSMTIIDRAFGQK